MVSTALIVAIVVVAVTLLVRQQVMMSDIKRAGLADRISYSHEGKQFRMNLAELHREVKPRSRFRRFIRNLLWAECILLVVLAAMRLLANTTPEDDHVHAPHPNSASTGTSK